MTITLFLKYIAVLIFSGVVIGVGLFHLYESYNQDDPIPGIIRLILGGCMVGMGFALIVSLCIKIMIF